jgi:hypothetical protein
MLNIGVSNVQITQSTKTFIFNSRPCYNTHKNPSHTTHRRRHLPTNRKKDIRSFTYLVPDFKFSITILVTFSIFMFLLFE